MYQFITARGAKRLAASAVPFLIVLIPLFRLSATSVVQAQGQSQSAQSADVEGDLEVEVEDSATGSRVHHYVKVNGKRLRLLSLSGSEGWQSGTRVRVRGRLANDTLELSGGGSVQVLALASPNTFGEQRVAVILVNFQGSVSAPYTTTFAQNVTFGETHSYYQEASYGQTSLTGQVYGWYTLPMSAPSTCTSTDYNAVATQADQVATANGVNLSQFNRKVYAFPQWNACGWWGLGSVGGNPSRSWINGSYALKVVAHELGHNFGLYHSNSMPCSTSGCSTTEYGDDRDMMGMSSVGHFNAFQKERLGWLNYGNSPAIQNITSAGTYWIEAYGTASNGGPKALRILKSTDAAGKKTWYYVESRARVGADNGFAAGVIVHTGSEATGNSSYQVDVDPTTSAFDSLLDPSQVFADATIDLAIQTMSASDAGAFVQVSFPGTSCSATSPTVTVSPGSATTQPGSPVSLNVTVRNNDDTNNCSSTSFSLGVATPLGWPATYGVPSLTVAPGATASTSLTVTPSSTGSGAVTASLARVNTSGPGGSGSATVTASAPTACTAAAPTVTLTPGSAVTTPGTPVTLTLGVRNNDSTTGCAHTTFSLSRAIPSGWSATFGQSSLTVAPGATQSTTLSVTPSVSGAGSVNASAARVGSSGPGGSASATITAASSLYVGLSIVKSNAYQITATVTTGSTPLTGVPVSFSVRSPTGNVTSYSATTAASGVAKITVRLKGKDPKGTYSVTATASNGGLTGSASGIFSY